MRRIFFRRIAGLVALMVMLAVAGGAFAFWLIGVLMGRTGFWDGRPLPPFFRFAGWGVLVLGIVALVFMLRALRRAAAPVGEIMEAAGRVETGDYSVRVAERGPAEVRALARSFNAMTARLQRDAEQRRALLADVTHELRTPLTVIQGNLEGLLDGIYPRDDEHLAPILEESRVMARLIEDLRTLALADSGALKLQREPSSLEALARETVAAFQAQADHAGVELKSRVPADLPVLDVDPVRIRAVLGNLVANALRYTPSGGWVEIGALLERDNHCVRVRVSDNGAGIAPEVLPHLFDRFSKSRDSLGSGLGLAIAKNLITLHGGQITAASELGGGTTVEFTLPISQ
jgi:two-component system, OmpR family, sensor histidine kinase BaeS